MGTRRGFRTERARFAATGSIWLLAASLSLLAACGGGQPSRADAADADGRDGTSDRATTAPPDANGDGAGDAPAASGDASSGTDGAPDTAVATDAGDAAADGSADAGPDCTLGTATDRAGCGDPACTLANTLTACTSADHCARGVCAVGFGNCNVSSVDCETSFAAGGTCLPRYLGTTAFATNSLEYDWTTIGTDGSFFLAGAFAGTVDFDPTGAQDLHSSAGPGDVGAFITKLNADGSYGWTRSFAESGVSLGHIAAASNGAVVAVGVFYDSIDLDPGPGVDLHHANATTGGRQALVVKLAADGSEVWGRTFAEGAPYRSYSSADAVAVDATDAVYVGGMFTAEVDFDPGPGTALRTAPLVGDALLVKLTPTGDFSWVQTIDDPGDCHTQLTSLAVGTDGTVWGVGWTGAHPSCEGSAPGPGSQPLIAAYTAAGDIRGVWHLPPAQYPAYAFGVSAAANGAVYVGGAASGLIDLDPGPSAAMRWAGTSQGGFVVKLASDASLLWAVAVPDVWVNSVAATSDGGVIAVGQGLTAVVAKLGVDGTPAWSFTTGGSETTAEDVAARGSNFVVVGSSQGSGDFDPGPGTDIVDGDVRFLSRFGL